MFRDFSSQGDGGIVFLSRKNRMFLLFEFMGGAWMGCLRVRPGPTHGGGGVGFLHSLLFVWADFNLKILGNFYFFSLKGLILLS